MVVCPVGKRNGMESSSEIARKMMVLPAKLAELFVYDALQHAKHDYENVFLRTKSDIESLTELPLSECSVLILGCGYNYPDVILFSEVSRNVVGLDIINTFYRDGLLRGGIQALPNALKLRRGYYRHLSEISGVAIRHQKYRLVSYDGERMPFKKGMFDVVASNAVLEHLEKPETVLREIHRVTKHRGVSHHLWHNYYSFSGSHLPKWLCAKHPWGHLRGKYRTYGLNKAKASQIQAWFSEYFTRVKLFQVDARHRKKGVDPDFQFEHRELLSPDIRKELHAFPTELLLTRACLIMAVKP